MMEKRPRVESIDLLRGLVMILMLLDHTRSGWNEGTGVDPLDFAAAGPWVFLTRWITHFCAPVFVLLTGLSASLARHGSLLMLRRGALLIVLELFVVSILWGRVFFLGSVLFQVIWAIGIGLVVLAALRWGGSRLAGTFGLLVIVLHNLLPHLRFSESWANLAWGLFHQKEVVVLSGFTFEVLYPAIPWVGVMALGYGLGELYRAPEAFRRRWLTLLGTVFTVGFFVVRGLNGYGDPDPWQVQSTGVHTVLDFLKVEKYPPSLDYLLMTLGPAFLFLAALDAAKPRRNHLLMVLGRNALFYYLVHLPVLAVVLILAATVRYFGGWDNGWGASLPFRFDLAWTYVVWALLVPVLYALCRVWENRKTRKG